MSRAASKRTLRAPSKPPQALPRAASHARRRVFDGGRCFLSSRQRYGACSYPRDFSVSGHQRCEVGDAAGAWRARAVSAASASSDGERARSHCARRLFPRAPAPANACSLINMTAAHAIRAPSGSTARGARVQRRARTPQPSPPRPAPPTADVCAPPRVVAPPPRPLERARARCVRPPSAARGASAPANTSCSQPDIDMTCEWPGRPTDGGRRSTWSGRSTPRESRAEKRDADGARNKRGR